MTTRQWLFVGLIIVVLFSLFSSNEKKTKYELVNRRGQMFRVYVPPERAHDQTAYEQAIRDIGRSESIYAVLFWNDRSKIPPASQVEMTDEQLDAQVAHYNRNTTTGYNMFGWIKNSDLVEVGPVQ